MVAEGWIKSIEVIFAFMELENADRVGQVCILSTEGDARIWWEGVLVTVNIQTLTLEGFKDVFYSK